MADEDKKLVLGVGVEGAPQAAAALKDVETAATRTGEAVGNTAKESNRAADAGDNLASGLTHQAREMQHAEDAGRAVSDILSGRLAPAAIDATRGMAGFTALLAENPFMLAIIGIGAVAEIFSKISEASAKAAEKVEADEKKMAEATAKAADQIAKSLGETPFEKWSEDAVRNLKSVADQANETANAFDKLNAAKDKQAEAATKKQLAEIDLNEANAVADAQKRGASREEIEGIKLGFEQQKQQVAAEGEAAQANAKVREADSKVTKDQRIAEEKAKEADVAQGGLDKDKQREQGMFKSEQEKYYEKQGELASEIGGVDAELNAPGFELESTREALNKQLEEAQKKLDEATTNYEKEKAAHQAATEKFSKTASDIEKTRLEGKTAHDEIGPDLGLKAAAEDEVQTTGIKSQAAGVKLGGEVAANQNAQTKAAADAKAKEDAAAQAAAQRQADADARTVAAAQKLEALQQHSQTKEDIHLSMLEKTLAIALANHNESQANKARIASLEQQINLLHSQTANNRVP